MRTFSLQNSRSRHRKGAPCTHPVLVQYRPQGVIVCSLLVGGEVWKVVQLCLNVFLEGEVWEVVQLCLNVFLEGSWVAGAKVASC